MHVNYVACIMECNKGINAADVGWGEVTNVRSLIPTEFEDFAETIWWCLSRDFAESHCKMLLLDGSVVQWGQDFCLAGIQCKILVNVSVNESAVPWSSSSEH